MKVKIKHKSNDVLIVYWDDELWNGELVMRWDRKIHRYIIDAENLSIDKVIEIFKVL